MSLEDSRIPQSSDTAARVEAELRKTVEHFRVIFQSVNDGILVQDRDFNCVYINDAGAKLCGLKTPENFNSTTVEEIVSRHELYDENDLPFRNENLPARRVFAGEEVAEQIFQMRPKNGGSTIWSKSTARPVKNSDGEVVFAVSVFRDVTAEKQIELEAKFMSDISSAFTKTFDFDQIVATLGDCIVPRLADWFGLELLDESGTPVPVYVKHRDPAKAKLAVEMRKRHPSDLSDEKSLVAAAMKCGMTFLMPEVPKDAYEASAVDAEHLAILKELAFSSVACVPLKSRERVIGMMNVANSRGRPALAVGTKFLDDLGARVGLALENARLFERTRRSEERLELALSGSGIGLWEWKITEDELYFSDRCHEIFGTDRKSFESKFHGGFQRFIHSDDRERVNAAVAESVATKKDYSIEYRVVRDSGEIRWIHAQGKTYYDDCGAPARMVGTVIDITDRRNSQKLYELAKEQAERANEAKSLFLANMSHEIRTPMNSILGFSNLLVDSRLSERERDDYSRRIQANGTQLLHLIDDILDLSRIEAGKMNMQIVDVDRDTLVADLESTLRLLTRGKNVRTELDISESMPDVFRSDELRLKQVLTNLIGNAAKFTDDGYIRVSMRRFESSLVFDVEDSGIGIDPDVRDVLFKPFSQADGSVTRKYGGTGLGLQLSRKICEALGGTLELIRSERNEGSLFRVAIPGNDITHIDRPTTPVSVRLSEALPANLEILLAEDSIDNQALVKAYLRGQNVRLTVANNGREAVEFACGRDFNLVLMDIQMPVMDGVEAVRKIRATGRTVPIVALTAHALPEEVERTMSAGCDAHLTKPLARTDLIQAIARWSLRK